MSPPTMCEALTFEQNAKAKTTKSDFKLISIKHNLQLTDIKIVEKLL